MPVQPKVQFFAGTGKEGFTVMAPLTPSGKDFEGFQNGGMVSGDVIYEADDSHLAHSLFAVGAIKNFASFAEKSWKVTGDLIFAVILGKELTKQLEGDN